MIAGKILMDRNAPDTVTDTAQAGYDDTKSLIEKWHGQGRNLYAVTPRFAPTSTPARILSAMISRARMSPGRTPRTMAPAATV